MPTVSEHITKAEHNKQVAEHIVSTFSSALDWSVIAYFYSALHYVDAFLKHNRAEPTSHANRGELLRRFGRQIREDYRLIQDEGYQARYILPYSINPTRLSELIRIYNNLVANVQASLRQPPIP